ncbi:hypothetical protein HYU21_03015 [Candidatus Woesearchaeota archaeon]|nr:hypothetical protein [Candidatus Woesearchaeota archaeon]
MAHYVITELREVEARGLRKGYVPAISSFIKSSIELLFKSFFKSFLKHLIKYFTYHFFLFFAYQQRKASNFLSWLRAGHFVSITLS